MDTWEADGPRSGCWVLHLAGSFWNFVHFVLFFFFVEFRRTFFPNAVKFLFVCIRLECFVLMATSFSRWWTNFVLEITVAQPFYLFFRSKHTTAISMKPTWCYKDSIQLDASRNTTTICAETMDASGGKVHPKLVIRLFFFFILFSCRFFAFGFGLRNDVQRNHQPPRTGHS